MTISDKDRKSAPNFSTSSRRAGQGFLTTFSLLIVAYVLFGLYAWKQTEQMVSLELDYMNQEFGQSISAMFRYQELVLLLIGDEIRKVGGVEDIDASRAHLRSTAARYPELSRIGVAGPDGEFLILNNSPVNVEKIPGLLDTPAKRDATLSAFDSGQMVVGRTCCYELLGSWLLPMRLAVRGKSGDVQFLVTDGITLDAAGAAWNRIEPRPEIRSMLIRDDGYMQIEMPVQTPVNPHLYDHPIEGYVIPKANGFISEPWVAGSVAKARRVEGYPMSVVSTYSEKSLFNAFAEKMAAPTTLLIIAVVMGWFVYLRIRGRQLQYESGLVHFATHDALTDLPNRLLLEDRIQQDTARSSRRGRSVAIMYLDLDQFKRVNDRYGHKTGDELLRECTQRLRSILRDGDTVGRLGGDEFLMIFPDLNGAEHAQSLAIRILDAFRNPFALEGREHFTSVSIGIALFPDDGEKTAQLLKNADIAMYHAKAQGRNNFSFFQPSLNSSATRQIDIANGLRTALAKQEMTVVYQPQSESKSLAWSGAEALLRWKSESLGEISPAEFIPIAEETGLIDDLGWFVVDTALRDLKQIHEQKADFDMAINVSVRQVRAADFIPTLQQKLEAAEVSPELIELEVTESIMAEEIEQLEALRAAGLRLAIDDFGTGFSCLSYLKRLPITTLKIDQEFVRDLETDPADKALVTAIIAIAREIGVQTVAEGVENQGQLNFLQTTQCDKLQGYLLGRPVPIDQILNSMSA